MVDFLKRSKPEGEKWEEDEKVRKSVEEILNGNIDLAINIFLMNKCIGRKLLLVVLPQKRC